MPPSDEAVVEARKAAVQKSTQKDTTWCILRSNGLPTYYRTLLGTVVATHGAPLPLSHDQPSCRGVASSNGLLLLRINTIIALVPLRI